MPCGFGAIATPEGVGDVVVAEQAAHVTVFQRTPNYSIPSRNGPMTCKYETEWKTEYAVRRETARHTRNGILYDLNDKSALDDTPEQRECTYTERWQKGGVCFMAAYNDLALNQASNDTAADLVRARICEIVRDPPTLPLSRGARASLPASTSRSPASTTLSSARCSRTRPRG